MIGDFLIVPQVQQARRLSGLGAMTETQLAKAQAMLQAMKNHRSRLYAWKGIGFPADTAIKACDGVISSIEAAIVTGNYDAAQIPYSGFIPMIETVYKAAQAWKPNTEMTATQQLETGPYGNKYVPPPVAPAPSILSNKPLMIALALGVGAAIYFAMKRS